MRVHKNPSIQNQEPLKEAVDKVKQAEGSDSMETTEKVINKSQRKSLISDEMALLFITQLQSELANHNLYNTFASYYNQKGLYKLVDYWKGRASEEYLHHQWVFNYLNQCNVFFEYPEIPIIKVSIEDDLDPFKFTVDREIETTGSINNIMNLAIDEKDFLTIAFLLGNGTVDGKLIPEQSEEMKLSMEALNIAKRDTDWLAKQDVIYNLYFKQ